MTPKMAYGGTVNCDPAAREKLLESSTRVTITSNKTKRVSKNQKSSFPAYVGPGGEPLPKTILNNVTQFQRRQPKGLIDVWWLYDDGGTLSHVIY
jgi:solute carrier family 12 sodium/potassium/chloride transporter 2